MASQRTFKTTTMMTNMLHDESTGLGSPARSPRTESKIMYKSAAVAITSHSRTKPRLALLSVTMSKYNNSRNWEVETQ